MKKVYTMSLVSLYLIVTIVAIGFTSLVVGSCHFLYYRSARALLMRSKYRACVRTLRMRTIETLLLPEERSFVVLNRCKVYLRESMISYMNTHGYSELLMNIDLADWDYRSEGVSQEVFLPASVEVESSSSAVLNEKIITMNTPFAWPLKRGSFWVSSLFGPRKRLDGSAGFHTGIDLAALKGTPVYAPRSGVVIQAYYTSGYGKTIVIQHGKKFRTRYAHLDKIHVAPGDAVRKNSIIGEVGDTGFVRKEGKDGSHLHFEVYEYEKRVNPMQFLPELV